MLVQEPQQAAGLAAGWLALFRAPGHSAGQHDRFLGGDMINRLAAEAIGTFWLVFAGCGSALLSAGIPQLGIGVFGIAFAFGLAVVTMVYAIAHISGGHINPAVTVRSEEHTSELQSQSNL